MRHDTHRLDARRLLNTVRQHDYYLLTEDFDSCAYIFVTVNSVSDIFVSADIAALELVDAAYQDRVEWVKKSISTSAKMGKFSSDRAILDYAQECWVRFTSICIIHPLTVLCDIEHRARQVAVS